MDISKLSNILRRRLAISVYLENECIDALPTDRDTNNINISFWIHKTRRDNKRPVYKLGIHLELPRYHEYFSPANKNTCEKIKNILYKKLKQEYKIQLDINNTKILNTSTLFHDKIIYSIYTKSFTYNKIKQLYTYLKLIGETDTHNKSMQAKYDRLNVLELYEAMQTIVANTNSTNNSNNITNEDTNTILMGLDTNTIDLLLTDYYS